MTGREAFKTWAPKGAKWVDWVRPVPFVAIDKDKRANTIVNFIIPKITYLHEISYGKAIIIDLPGGDGIKEGLALARLGWRPIPIYNGTNEQPGAMAIVDNLSIESALLLGANELSKIKIDDYAPPAFLLDSNRLHRHKMSISVFDNSWDLYPQDVPSAEYFMTNGINKIIIRSDRVRGDLLKVFYMFQKKNITFYFTDGYEIKEVLLPKPPRRYR